MDAACPNDPSVWLWNGKPRSFLTRSYNLITFLLTSYLFDFLRGVLGSKCKILVRGVLCVGEGKGREASFLDASIPKLIPGQFLFFFKFRHFYILTISYCISSRMKVNSPLFSNTASFLRRDQGLIWRESSKIWPLFYFETINLVTFQKKQITFYNIFINKCFE